MKAIDATSPRPVNIFQTPTAGLDKCMTTETAKSVVACRTAFINMLNIIDRKINTRKESKVVERPETTLEQFIHAASLSPFFTKMLQVLTQVYDLPTEVKLAMERTQFDTAVMGPLEMWEAIKTVSEQQPRFRDIVEHPTFRLGEYIGGGSLFTVFKVEYKGKLYALRMANPSPDAFIHQAYLLTIEVCDGMLKDPNYKNWHKWLRVLRTLAGVSKEWCTRELAAENIVEDDKHFEQMIQNIGKVNSTAISIPSTLYQGERCSLTELVEFELNGAEAVSQGGKNSARVIEVMDTIHQASLTTNTLKGGVQVLPDPHPGNILMTYDAAYIVDRQPYMKFDETQLSILYALYEGRYLDFALGLLRELEIGKLQTAKVAGQTVVELRGILVGHLRGEKIDGQKVVREVLNVLAQNGIELPLEWWLYSRNCVMLESLKKSIGKDVGEEKRIKT